MKHIFDSRSGSRYIGYFLNSGKLKDVIGQVFLNSIGQMRNKTQLYKPINLSHIFWHANLPSTDDLTPIVSHLVW